jgi:hypothetical protein
MCTVLPLLSTRLVPGLFGRPYAGGEFYVGSMGSSCEAHGGGRTHRQNGPHIDSGPMIMLPKGLYMRCTSDAVAAVRPDALAIVCVQVGGAVYSRDGPLTVKDSSFYGNTAVSLRPRRRHSGLSLSYKSKPLLCPAAPGLCWQWAASTRLGEISPARACRGSRVEPW